METASGHSDEIEHPIGKIDVNIDSMAEKHTSSRDQTSAQTQHKQSQRHSSTSQESGSSPPILKGLIAGTIPYLISIAIYHSFLQGSMDNLRGISVLELSVLSFSGMFGGVTMEYSAVFAEEQGNFIEFVGSGALIGIAVAGIPLLIVGYLFASRVGSEIGSYTKAGALLSIPYGLTSYVGASWLGNQSFESVSRGSIGAVSLRGPDRSAEYEVTANVFTQVDPIMVAVVAAVFAFIIGAIAGSVSGWRR